jgi:iron(III) transport system ATP-binding protein
MTDALHCIQLSKRFGEVVALDSADLTVAAGLLLALLGPSGCGKTTLLRLVAGFETPDSGEIRIKGQPIANKTTFVEPEARHVGMVFQDYALFPHLNVADNIGFGLKRGDQGRVYEMLTLVGLDGFGRRMPYELSGGQQQRVALARALAPSPDIVLLDEPFSNLDTALRAQVRADVRTILREAGTTAVFVTHDQEEALSLADEVGVMLDGHIIQVAEPQHLYQHPVNPAVATFVGEANFLPGEASGQMVACALGQLKLFQPTHGPVEVMIRPEGLHLRESADGAAQVIWREFYGHDQRIGLRLDDGSALIARADSAQIITPGQHVTLQVVSPVQAFSH